MKTWIVSSVVSNLGIVLIYFSDTTDISYNMEKKNYIYFTSFQFLEALGEGVSTICQYDTGVCDVNALSG